MRVRSLLLALLFGASLAAGCASAADEPLDLDQEFRYREVKEHRIGPEPVVLLPWADLTRIDVGERWVFRLTVDTEGHVTGAVPRHKLKGAAAAEALRLVKAMRFKPFESDGHAVRVTFDYGIESMAQDYAGPADRAFPSNPDPKQISIALQRTGCFGTCPSYRVEVRGDGWVTYRGDEYVIVQGTHRWRVPPAAVAALVERFRAAEYFKLDGYYITDITDNPTYVSRLSIGSQRKFVYDYAGAMPVMSPEGPDLPSRMPKSVSELENAIDEATGVLSWVRGDEHTMDKLWQAKWNFRSAAAGRGLAVLLGDCSTALAQDFIRAGAPVNLRSKGFGVDLPMTAAPRCGNLDLVRMLEAKGALKRKADADKFLLAAVRSGFPELVELALKHASLAGLKGEDGEPPVHAAIEAMHFGNGQPTQLKFDPARVVALLTARGADPNAGDHAGNTPLHKTSTAQLVQALVAGGADPNALNHRDQTPLFGQRYADVAKALLHAGCDVNAQDFEGRTALESAPTQEMAELLLEAGARLPSDPGRLDELLAKAWKNDWIRLLPVFVKAVADARSGTATPR